MAETLVIRLTQHDEASPSWMLVDDAGNPSGAAHSGSLSDAASLAAGRRVIAIVPGIDVTLAEPELPVRGGARLAQVVPFALEEHLAEDVDHLHFAIGRREDERPGTPVAVVARARMDAWLAALRAAQLAPQSLYVDSALLPANPAHTILLIEEDRLYVRHPQGQPFVLNVAPLETALELAGLYQDPADDSETPPEPRHVIVYLSEDDWNRHQAALDAARELVTTLNVQLLPAGALPLFAQQAATQSALNLLQGPYAARSQLGDVWQKWRVAAILLACVIGLNLAGKGVQLWRLKQTERSLDAAIAQTFHEAMPGESSVGSARRRMESRLAAIHGSAATGGAGILQMLSVTGSALSQVPGARISALNFRTNVLDLKVQAGDIGALSRLETLAGQGGFSAQLQSSSNTASGVEGRVQIKGGAAK